MPMVQEFWKKLSSNEKMVMYGVSSSSSRSCRHRRRGGFGEVSAIVGAAIVDRRHVLAEVRANQTIKWPAPIQTIVLVIAGIAAIFAALGGSAWIGFFGSSVCTGSAIIASPSAAA